MADHTIRIPSDRELSAVLKAVDRGIPKLPDAEARYARRFLGRHTESQEPSDD